MHHCGAVVAYVHDAPQSTLSRCRIANGQLTQHVRFYRLLVEVALSDLSACLSI